MIVGASVLQLPAILKAKELGLDVAVVDYNPQAIGVQYADHYYNASTMDEDAVVRAAVEFNPDGIMTLATDMPMRGVAKAASMLGLPSISYDTAVKATDKFEMIKAFKEFDVPSPWFFLIENVSDFAQLKNNISYPCIMKPVDNAGSHGVVLINSYAELMSSYEYSRKNSRSGKVLVEEYLDGPEVSVEIIVVNGIVHVLQITDKLTTGAPHFVELGHSQPTQLNDEVQNGIRNVAIAACRAVDINHGPAHVEMKVTSKNGPKMIELGARMGGDNITTHLVPLSTGVDMVDLTIRLALGETPVVLPTLHCGSAIRYIQAPIGVIRSINGISDAESVEGVRHIVFTKQVGDESTEIRCSNDRIGFIIAQSESAQAAVVVCQESIKKIQIITN